MRVEETKLSGVFLIEVEPQYDERGYLTRTYDKETFKNFGLASQIAQESISYDSIIGTLRGLHWQISPGEDTKTIRVIEGRIFDVVVDLRPESPQYGQWIGKELSAEEGQALYIPERCAHGFMTLEDQSRVLYQLSKPYQPELSRTLRWDDPDLSIEWPIAPRVLSRQDASCSSRFADMNPKKSNY